MSIIIPPEPFRVVFSPPGAPVPPPPGARHALGRNIGTPILALPVGPEPGVTAWRFIPVNEEESLYEIRAALEGGNAGFSLAGGRVVPDARIIFGEQRYPWIVQAEEVDGGYLATIQARTPGVGATAYVSVKDVELALEFLPVVPDVQAPKWFLQRL